MISGQAAVLISPAPNQQRKVGHAALRIKANVDYTRKRQQMRLAKGLDFLENFLTY